MKTLVSFSGGRTSAYMCKQLLDTMPREDLIFVFANTGLEHEKTYAFVDQVDKHFGLDLYWVEACVHSRPKVGTTHRIVDFQSATKGPALFQAMAFKYGIPGPGWAHCTRELKERPIHSLMKSLKIEKYKTAIGIRADEIDRVHTDYQRYDFIYPLAEQITKADILKFWSAMPFDLDLPEHLGNCKACWKKSAKKLSKIATENPEYLTELFVLDQMGDYGAGPTTRKMFRGRRSARDVLEAQAHQPADDVIEGSCAESCEPFGQGYAQ